MFRVRTRDAQETDLESNAERPKRHVKYLVDILPKYKFFLLLYCIFHSVSGFTSFGQIAFGNTGWTN